MSPEFSRKVWDGDTKIEIYDIELELAFKTTWEMGGDGESERPEPWAKGAIQHSQ